MIGGLHKDDNGDVLIELDNQDAHVDEKELDAVGHRYEQIARQFNRLAAYAEKKSIAMRLRKGGIIDVAMKFEAECQAIFDRLEAPFRW